MHSRKQIGRRGFLGALAGLVSGAVLDPELALWKPGKLISIPAAKNTLITHSDLTADTLRAFQKNTTQVKLVMRFSSDFYSAHPVGRMLEIRRPMRFKGSA